MSCPKAGRFFCAVTRTLAGGFAWMMPPPIRGSWRLRSARLPNGWRKDNDTVPDHGCNRLPNARKTPHTMRTPTPFFSFFSKLPLRWRTRFKQEIQKKKTARRPGAQEFFLLNRRSRFLIGYWPEPIFVKKRRKIYGVTVEGPASSGEAGGKGIGRFSGHTPGPGRTAGGAQRHAPQEACSPAKPEGDASTPGVGARNCDITAALTTGGSADVEARAYC